MDTGRSGSALFQGESLSIRTVLVEEDEEEEAGEALDG